MKPGYKSRLKITSLILLFSLLFGLFSLYGCALPADPSDKTDQNENDKTDKNENEENNEENNEDDSVSISGLTNPEKYTPFTISEEKVRSAIDAAMLKVDMSLELYGSDKFPTNFAKDEPYSARDNKGGWWQGFWTGMLWHAYELTENDKYRTTAQQHVLSFYQRIYQKNGVDNHDMGFLFSLSCVAAYRKTGDPTAKAAALMAADHLITRYNERSEFIQAWGEVGEEAEFRLIIDCLMNIPLLYWATEVTGDQKYKDMAYRHFLTTSEVIYRADGSTYHTYFFDANTGEPLRGATKQGAGDETTWSRGQSWGIYGPMLTHVYMKDEKSLEVFREAAIYYLNNIPSDYVAYWDLCYNDGDYEPKDSSSASIAACAFLEAAKHLDESDPYREIYLSAAHRIMNSLIDHYTTKDIPNVNGLLLHGTNSGQSGIDHMQIWGDYFYLEALHRLVDPDWQLYW